MKRKVVSVVLSALLAMSLAACGGSSTSSTAEAPASEAPAAEEAAEEEAPAGEEAPAAEAAEEASSEAAPAASGSYAEGTPADLAAVYDKLQGSGLKVALSNSYVGNSWRAQMINTFDAYCKNLQSWGVIDEYYSTSCGNDSDAQINDISNMISAGYNIIVVDAASPTALVDIAEEAMDRGVIVVGFDSTIDSDVCYNVNVDAYDYGYQQAHWLAEQMGGKGNLINVRGVEGSTVDRDRYKGQTDALSEYPDIETVSEVWGEFDDATTSAVLVDALSALSGTEINAILESGGGDNGLVEAMKKAELDFSKVYVAGDYTNGIYRSMVEDGLLGFTASDPCFLSASAVQIGLRVAAGEEVEKMTYIDMPTGDYTTADQIYQPDLPDNVVVAWTDETNSFGLTIDDVIPDNQ